MHTIQVLLVASAFITSVVSLAGKCSAGVPILLLSVYCGTVVLA